LTIAHIKEIYINILFSLKMKIEIEESLIDYKKSFKVELQSDIIHFMLKKNKKQKDVGKVILPTKHPNPPEQHEIESAYVIAEHFKCTVEFLLPIDDFKRSTADIMMLGVRWELKCPTGDSQSTIQNQFRRAKKQAKNIIIDTRRTKLSYETIEKRVRFEMKNHPKMKRVILIDKFEKVIEIKKQT